MLGEGLRVALAGHNVPEDPQAGHAGDVADYQRSCTFVWINALPPLDQGPGALDERAPMPEIAAQGHDPIGGTEAPAQQPEDVQVAEPFTVGDITLLRPGRFFTWRGLTRTTWKPRASRISKMGIR